MKKTLIISILLIAIIASTIYIISGSSNNSSQNIIKVNAATFNQLVQNPDFTILDIRTEEEFRSGTILSSINVDYYKSESFKSELNKLDKSKKYLVYCRSGNRSAKAIEIMKSLGFTDVTELDGGIISWQAAGLPTIKP